MSVEDRVSSAWCHRLHFWGCVANPTRRTRVRAGRLMCLVVVGVVLGACDDVWAWGPATHVGLASSILDRLGVLPGAIGALLARQSAAYLFGNIAADVVFAKRLSRIKQFCHHWSTGFRLLAAAEGDASKAFSYGYLSHLAADTVAHGKFVPRQVTMSRSTINFGHVYWEARADASEPVAHWHTLRRVLAADHDPHHRSLQYSLSGALLPYDWNRRIFDGVNALALRRPVRGSMGVWSPASRWYLCPNRLAAYRSECVDRIVSILTEGHGSSLLHEDPNGTSALMQVRVQRRDMRRRRRRGLPVGKRVLEACKGMEASAA